jgi:hypothetical protein
MLMEMIKKHGERPSSAFFYTLAQLTRYCSSLRNIEMAPLYAALWSQHVSAWTADAALMVSALGPCGW